MTEHVGEISILSDTLATGGKLLSDVGRSDVVPFRQKFIMRDTQVRFHFFGCVTLGLVEATDNIDGGPQSSRCLRATHQLDDSIDRVE